MKPIFFYLPILLLTCLFGSCTKENLTSTQPGKGMISLSYTLDDLQTMATTPNTNEAQLNDVYLMFYNTADNAFVNHQLAQVISGGSLNFTFPDGVEPGKSYRVLVVGNYDSHKVGGKSFADYMAENSSRNYLQMKELMYSEKVIGQVSKRVVTPLPYCGTLVGEDGQSEVALDISIKGEISMNMSVKFRRIVCRFDIVNKAAAKLRILGVKVCNFRSAGFVFHNDSPKGNLVDGTIHPSPTTEPLSSDYVTVAAPSDGRQTIQGGLYAYPNIVSSVTQNDRLTTYLMIAGYYEGSSVLSYYRANVAINGENQVLRSNNIYTITINDVMSAGSNDELKASGEGVKSLDYTIGNTWQDDSDNSISDGQGNFLTVSTNSIVLESEVGSPKVVRVSVKSTGTWNLTWVTPDSPFDFNIIDASSFRITPKTENSSSSLKNAVLKVTAPGTSLSMLINVSQLSSATNVKMLMVDGHATDYTVVIPGQGANMRLQVLTGSVSAEWTASITEGDMIEGLSSAGSHQEYITFTTGFNFSGAERIAKLTVKRNPLDGVPNITITVKQKPTDYVVALSPSGAVKINGFSTTRDDTNNQVRDQMKEFTINIADPDNYTCKVELKGNSDFNKNADAFLSLNRTEQLYATYGFDYGQAKTMIEGLTNKQSFFLHTFRTGPGDPDINLSLIVTAVPKNSSGKSSYHIIPVTITTNCTLGDCQVQQYLVADRNCGAVTKYENDKGYNYTAATIGNPPSNRNTGFKGDFYIVGHTPTAIDQLTNECGRYGAQNYGGGMSKGWKVPTQAQLNIIASRVIFSKERAFILSDVKTSDHQPIGCFFPLSGTSFGAGNESFGTPLGCYWSQDAKFNGEQILGRYYSMFTTNRHLPSLNTQLEGLSLRCIR